VHALLFGPSVKRNLDDAGHSKPHHERLDLVSGKSHLFSSVMSQLPGVFLPCVSRLPPVSFYRCN